MLTWVNPDGRKLMLARALRSIGYGATTTVIGPYLHELDLSTASAGVLLTSAIGGSAIATLLSAFVTERLGRRRTLAIMALLMTAAGLAFALSSDFAVLLVATFTGTVSATGAEVGAFQTLDQALLPQTAAYERRTKLFTVHHTLGVVSSALGSLLAATVTLITALGPSGPDAYRPLFLLYATLGLANVMIFRSLSDRIEHPLASMNTVTRVHPNALKRLVGLHRSARNVAKLAALMGVDSLAGGLTMQSLVSYWFYLQWQLEPVQLGAVFFVGGSLSALSLFSSSWIAERIGLVNTIVFTQLPSNLMVLLIPLVPSASLAVALVILRMSISQMDLSVRESYTMAIVDADERTASAGITTIVRMTASIASPSMWAYMVQSGILGLPFYLSGALKLLYNWLLYLNFHDVRAPEELERRLAQGLLRDDLGIADR
jgi:MFS family permease